MQFVGFCGRLTGRSLDVIKSHCAVLKPYTYLGFDLGSFMWGVSENRGP